MGLTGATHLLFITTGKYTHDAIRYVERIMQSSSLSIYLIDGEAVARIRKDPHALADILTEGSEAIQNRWLNRPAWLDDPIASQATERQASSP